MKQILIIGLILISQIGFSQIKEMNPTSTNYLEFSSDGEKEFNEGIKKYEQILEKLDSGIKPEDLNESEKKLFENFDETMESYWDIIGGGCSWYCAGGPMEVTASSFLESQGDNNYRPENAHDLSYKTAWVEGVAGYGIGENLVYHFAGSAPRINKIIVINGYIKNPKSWKDNSRVKKLKVYINDKEFAIFNLEDLMCEQSFDVPLLGKYSDEKWTLKFEILEVYQGDKYDDVAITEIYFDGIDVHCFAKGTKIQLPDNSTKNIEDLKVGDLVAYMDFNTKSIKSAEIVKMEKVIHHALVTYRFESGLTITATQDHPFSIENRGWASLKPDKSSLYKGFENIDKINIGDIFLTSNGTDKLISIDFLEGDQETYTISKLSSGDNFIANGLIVGIEELND